MAGDLTDAEKLQGIWADVKAKVDAMSPDQVRATIDGHYRSERTPAFRRALAECLGVRGDAVGVCSTCDGNGYVVDLPEGWEKLRSICLEPDLPMTLIRVGPMTCDANAVTLTEFGTIVATDTTGDVVPVPVACAEYLAGIWRSKQKAS